MSIPFEKNIQIMQQAAREAGAILLKYYKTDLEIELKPEAGNSPVTKADKEADTFLQKTLMAAQPNYGWLSEESEDDPSRLEKDIVWVVDPLDGTKAFITHNSEFSVSIGLTQNGKPVAGVIYDPLANQMISAFKGGGVYVDGKKVENRQHDNMSEMVCLTSFTERKQGLWDEYESEFQMRNNPSMALKLAHVAAGLADFTVTLKPKGEWDTAAGHIMCEEAGLTVLDLYGKEVTYNHEVPLIDGMIVAAKYVLETIEELFNIPREPFPGY